MRVLHLPTAVGGGPSGMSRHLRKMGIESEVWTIDQDYLGYKVDRVIIDIREPIVLQMLKALKAGSYVFGRWDVVHFNYGSTLFSNGGKLVSRRSGESTRRGLTGALSGILGMAAGLMQRMELGILRARRIPYFVLYQGDDARQGDYSLAHYDISIATQVPASYYTPRSDRWKRRQIQLMTRRAAGVYAVNPDLLNVLPAKAEFLPYGHVAIPEWTPHFTQGEHDELVFVHAPSNRQVKGTAHILAALDELQTEGYRFRLELIEGMSNVDALERYKEADVVIDQLYAGWYGGVAVEAMALGKPVVAYLRTSDFQHLPHEMAKELPFFQATPTTIKDVLRCILELPRGELLERAKRSRAFVERWHDPAAIAARLADDYRRAGEARERKSGAQ